MVNIQVRRYTVPDADGKPVQQQGDPTTFWQGYIEPETRDWIMFVRGDGQPIVYLNRDPVTGAVLDLPPLGCGDTLYPVYPGERYSQGEEFEGVEPPAL